MKIQTTKKDEVFDITYEVQKVVSAQEKENGLCNIFIAHTTCSVTTADLDPGTDVDLLRFLRSLVPPKMEFLHPHDPKHAPDHLISSVIGQSVTIPFENKKLMHGTWQRIVLVELDGPREREINVSIV
jgi:secondary thiamine-phosphate synthase enzyme